MSRGTLIADLALMLNAAGRTRRLLSLKQQLALGAAVLMMTAIGYGAAQIPLLLGQIVDTSGGRLEKVWPLIFQITVIYVLCELLQLGRKAIVERCCTDVEYKASVAAVSSLLTSDIGQLRRETAGASNGRLHRNVQGVVKLLKLFLLDLAPSLAGAVFAIWAATRADVLLGLVMAAVVPVGMVLVVAQIASQTGIRRVLLAGKTAIDGAVVERLGGIETIRAADATDAEIGRIARLADALRRKEFQHHLVMASFDALKGLNEGAFHVGVAALAAWRWSQGDISGGDFMALTVLYLSIIRPLREIHRILDEAHESAINAGEYFELVKRDADRSFAVTLHRAPNVAAPAFIQARGLTVDYGLEGGRAAIDKLDIDLVGGETVALVGASGSGKTTLAKALVRLVHPTAGGIAIDGAAIETLSRTDLARQFCYIGQAPYLFTGTIAQNITFGLEAVGREQIRQAARLARVADEIESMPDGYETILTERGENLSGGQKQRIALARTFLSSARALIIDEATSALDNRSERAVIEAIRLAWRGRTVFIIAHRLANLRHVDRVLVFGQGRLIEAGTYAALEGSPGAFQALLKAGNRDGIATAQARSAA